MSLIRKLEGNVLFKSNKRRFITVNSHFNSSETNHLIASNSDDVIVNSNLPCINVHTKGSLNKFVTLQKATDTQSGTSINDEITDDNKTSEEISCHQNSAEVMDHTCGNNGNNALNIEEESDVTSINYINETTGISMNDDNNYMHKYYAPFLSSKNDGDVSPGS